MEEEFDLRPIIKKVLLRWKFIVSMAVLAALAAFAVRSFVPVSYQAKSLVAFFQSDNNFQFDIRITESITDTPFRSLPDLAKSDEVLTLVIASLPETYDYDRESLGNQLSVALGDDPSVIQFSATAATPQAAAEIANIWSEIFINWANDLYSSQNGRQVQYFEEQLSEAKARLNQANQNLVDFSQVSQSIILSNTLQVTQQNHVAKLEQFNELRQITKDTDALQQLIQTQSQDSPVSFANQLSYLQLQLAVFGGIENPVFLQTSLNGEISTIDTISQIAMLMKFREIVDQKLLETEVDLSQLEDEILNIQFELQESLLREDQLIREVQIANETVTTLGFKVEEEKVAALDISDGFKLISLASPPKNPTGPRRIVNAAIAGALGLSLAVGIVIVQVWWQGLEPSSGSNNPISHE